MIRKYSEEDKIKYVQGFKNCTLPLREYADKMLIDAVELKAWIKEYQELPMFGKINVSELIEGKNVERNAMHIKEEAKSGTPEHKSESIKFESPTIKIELKENYNKEMLKKLLEVLV